MWKADLVEVTNMHLVSDETVRATTAAARAANI
jgi:hypothetical protein